MSETPYRSDLEETQVMRSSGTSWVLQAAAQIRKDQAENTASPEDLRDIFEGDSVLDDFLSGLEQDTQAEVSTLLDNAA